MSPICRCGRKAVKRAASWWCTYCHRSLAVAVRGKARQSADKVAAKKRAYRERNRDKVAAKQRAYYERKKAA